MFLRISAAAARRPSPAATSTTAMAMLIAKLDSESTARSGREVRSRRAMAATSREKARMFIASSPRSQRLHRSQAGGPAGGIEAHQHRHCGEEPEGDDGGAGVEDRPLEALRQRNRAQERDGQ